MRPISSPTFTELCEHAGIGDEALATLLGYGDKTIRNWRKEHRQAPEWATLQLKELCRVLDAYDAWLQKDKIVLDGARDQAYI